MHNITQKYTSNFFISIEKKTTQFMHTFPLWWGLLWLLH